MKLLQLSVFAFFTYVMLVGCQRHHYNFLANPTLNNDSLPVFCVSDNGECTDKSVPESDFLIDEYSPHGLPAVTMWHLEWETTDDELSTIIYGHIPKGYAAYTDAFPLETGIPYEVSGSGGFILLKDNDNVRVVTSETIWDILSLANNTNEVFPDPPAESIFGVPKYFSPDITYKYTTTEKHFINNDVAYVNLTLYWRVVDNDAYAKRMRTEDRALYRVSQYVEYSLTLTEGDTEDITNQQYDLMKEKFLANFHELMPEKRFGIEIVDLEFVVSIPGE